MHSLATSVAALLAGASTVSGTVFSLNESYDVTNFFDKFDFFEVYEFSFGTRHRMTEYTDTVYRAGSPTTNSIETPTTDSSTIRTARTRSAMV